MIESKFVRIPTVTEEADKFTIFADGFNIPTSMTFARGGVLLAHAPDMLFLKDTDGDDRADIRARFSSLVLEQVIPMPVQVI